MYAVNTPARFSVMLERMVKAWLKGRQVTVTYMKPEYDQPRVRTWNISDIFVSEDGAVCVLAWDSYHDEVRTFLLERVTHYTVHYSRYDVAQLSDSVADQLAGSVESEDSDLSVADEWEFAAACEVSAMDWFESHGLPAQAQRAWENTQFAWRMADANRDREEQGHEETV